MKDLFGSEVSDIVSDKKGNPLIALYGPGQDGKKCKPCTHLYRKKYSKVYIKCDLRKDTNGPGTDHKANFPACGKYEEIPWDQTGK